MDVGGDLEVQAGAVSLSRVVVLVTCTVAGGDVGAVHQDDPASDGFPQVGDVKTESLSDKGKNAPINS